MQLLYAAKYAAQLRLSGQGDTLHQCYQRWEFQLPSQCQAPASINPSSAAIDGANASAMIQMKTACHLLQHLLATGHVAKWPRL